jgi:hypothetical protein
MTNQERQQQEIQRLELELRQLQISTANKIERMRRRLERIKAYGKEEKRDQASG